MCVEERSAGSGEWVEERRKVNLRGELYDSGGGEEEGKWGGQPIYGDCIQVHDSSPLRVGL